MPRLFPLAGLLVISVPCPVVSAGADESAAWPRIERNIVYRRVGDEKLELDLAIPPSDGPFPAVVMFHGGAWMGGSRAETSAGRRDEKGRPRPSWIETAALHGYVAASVSYRLAPRHKFPAMIEDARSAIRFLRANAPKYKIDPGKFAACGFSAGGHLSLLCGYCDKSAGFDVGENLDQNGQVQCVVSFFGPTDLALYAATPGIEDGYMVPVFGKGVKTDPTIYKKASPLTYVAKDSPPTLLFHGTLDLVVPIKHSERLHRSLKDLGVPTELVTVPFGGHGGWRDRQTDQAITTTFRFLDTHLKGQKK